MRRGRAGVAVSWCTHPDILTRSTWVRGGQHHHRWFCAAVCTILPCRWSVERRQPGSVLFGRSSTKSSVSFMSPNIRALPRLQVLQLIPADVSTDLDYRERFTQESDLAAALWHPNILGITDRGEFEGQLWLSRDYVDGADTATLLGDQHPDGMPPKMVVEIVSAVADALDYAHDHGVLHQLRESRQHSGQQITIRHTTNYVGGLRCSTPPGRHEHFDPRESVHRHGKLYRPRAADGGRDRRPG